MIPELERLLKEVKFGNFDKYHKVSYEQIPEEIDTSIQWIFDRYAKDINQLPSRSKTLKRVHNLVKAINTYAKAYKESV